MGEKECVSEKNAIVSIPLIVGIDIVRIDVELAVIVTPDIEPALL
jgi:hypothetical protein